MPEHPAHIAPQGPRPIARVLVDTPLPQLDRLFDYQIPREFVHEAKPGVRVKVPLKSAGRVLQGYIVEVGEETDPERALAEIDTVVSDAVVLPDRLYRLARAVADRSAGSATDVLRLAIPRRMVRAEKAWLAHPEGPDIDPLAGATDELASYPGLTDALTAGERLALDAPPGVVGLVPEWARLLASIAASAIDRGTSAIIAVPDHRDLDRLLSGLDGIVPPAAIVRVDADQTAQERYAAYLRTTGA
ncbi:MAG: primosomal protein N', partial [Microbacterium gubbeenense]